MAWTWSAPQRRAFACGVGLAAANQRMTFLIGTVAQRDTPRFVFAAVGLFLTAVGVCVPLLADEALTAVLFVLAGLAGFVAVFIPRPASAVFAATQLLARDHGGAAVATLHQPQARPRPQPQMHPHVHPQARFLELSPRDTPSSVIDRARWAQLTAHMSHELRTPLNAVLGFSEMMTKEVFGPMGSQCYSDYARSIHLSGRMLLKTAEDALAITALLTAPDHRPMPMSACLTSAVGEALDFQADRLAEKALTISLTCLPDSLIIADPQLVRQLLINVLADTSERAACSSDVAISFLMQSGCIDVQLTYVPSPASYERHDETFAILLARTLAELSGASLTQSIAASGAQVCVIRFVAADQRDFFTAH